MKIGVYTGSFDPITLGHLDIIERASRLVTKLVIAVTENPQKKHLLTIKQREALVKKATKHLKNVSTALCTKLTIDVANEIDADVLIRGIRSGCDAEQEIAMASMNLQKGKIDTIFLTASPQLAHIHSKFVRDFLINGQIPTEFVPSSIEKALRDLFCSSA